MKEVNLNPQIPQPTPPVHFPKMAVILGGVVVVFVTTLVIGAVFYFKNSKPMTKEQPHTIIYGELRNPSSFVNQSIVIYSVNSDTKIQRELFNIPVPYPPLYDVKFCDSTNKIYLRGLHYIYGNSNSFVTEIDLKGNVRDLDFTGAPSPSSGGYFALSKDCQKIVWGTTYYDDYVSDNKRKAAEIAFAYINGSSKRVLQIIKLSPNDNESFNKYPYSWSTTDPNVVYLTNPGDKSGGLFKLELNTNSISQINAVPTDKKIMDISNNDKLIAYKAESIKVGSVPKSFVTNLANNSTIPINIGSKDVKISKFSPDSSKLAYTAFAYQNFNSYTFNPHDCPINLYIFDLLKKTDKLVTRIANVCGRHTDPDIFLKNSNFIDWLTNDTVIYVKDGKDLATININDGKETKLAPVSGQLLFIGVSDK